MEKDKNYEQQMYNKARMNLLLMIIFTLINIVLFVQGSGTVMLFSATVPYMSVAVGILSGFDYILKICAAITIVIMVLYLSCWIFSKQSPVWMIIAMVMFVIDTIALILVYIDAQDVSGILDLLIHIWVLYYLFIGIKHGYRLKKLNNASKENEDLVCSTTEDNEDIPK